MRKITSKKIIDAATEVAKEFDFGDSESAFWQCNLFSNAVVKTARLFDQHDLQLVLVEAIWQIDSGDVKKGQIFNHIIVKHNNTYIDYTIRQIDDKAKFPYISKKLPHYYNIVNEVDIEDHLYDDQKYIDSIVKLLDPTAIVTKSNPIHGPIKKHNPKKLKYLHGVFGHNPAKEIKVNPEDMKDAFSTYVESPIIKKKGSLFRLNLEELWAMTPKTLHEHNLSGNSSSPDHAKKVREWMKNPLIMVRYKFPDPEFDPDGNPIDEDVKALWSDDPPTLYVLDGTHRYNEAGTMNEYRLNPELNYDPLDVFILDLKVEDRELDPAFFTWLLKNKIVGNNWS